MPLLTLENFYKETITTSVATGAVNIYVSALPTPTSGYLVISPSSESLREIIKYTAAGTDGGGNYVTVTAPNRGLGGTTDQVHAAGEPIRMNYTAEHQLEISDAIDALSASGSPDSSTTTKGVGKLTASPNTTLGTVTVTITSPAVFSYTAHGLLAGDTIELTTTGALPTGLAASTRYFVISAGLTANAFQVSTSLAGAAVDTSGSQSGVHTLIRTTPFFVGVNDTRLLSSDEKAALVGTSGTPSSSNKFVTAGDVSTTSVADKIPRLDGSGEIPLPMLAKRAFGAATSGVATSGTATKDMFLFGWVTTVGVGAGESRTDNLLIGSDIVFKNSDSAGSSPEANFCVPVPSGASWSVSETGLSGSNSVTWTIFKIELG